MPSIFPGNLFDSHRSAALGRVGSCSPRAVLTCQVHIFSSQPLAFGCCQNLAGHMRYGRRICTDYSIRRIADAAESFFQSHAEIDSCLGTPIPFGKYYTNERHPCSCSGEAFDAPRDREDRHGACT